VIRQSATLKPAKPAHRSATCGKKMPVPVVPTPNAKNLPDEEWLRTYCGDIMTNLKHKAAFKNDALLYRRAQEKLAHFRGSMKKLVAEAKSREGHNGAFYATLYRLVKASHPQHWLICATCVGTGKDTAPGKVNEVCPKCFGAAYKMRLDD
jgi:hypothetical protein